jgi:hypothetical protein
MLSSPTVATSGTGLLLGALPGLGRLQDLSIGVLPWSGLLGLAVVPFAGFAAADFVRGPKVPKWIARTAVLIVVVGGLFQCGLALALMIPGVIELP